MLKYIVWLFVGVACTSASGLVSGQQPGPSTPLKAVSPAPPVTRTWQVEGVARQGLLYVPETAKSMPAPLVFCFHGHGGNTRNAARSFRLHEVWPEAIVVYLQGLNTPGQLTDPEGKKPGWQKSAGDQDDRDLKFFDAVLKSVRQDYRVDDRRVYSTGHSNGGGFTYLLWSERGSVFAAMAPSGAAALRLRNELPPKPVLHIAGRNDPLVKFTWQQLMIDRLKTAQKCGAGRPWQGGATEYPAADGASVFTLVTDEGHKFPAQAPQLIAEFFRRHAKPENTTSGQSRNKSPEVAR
jgi:polyhydroxybutyrate depolymerase